jgi:hypothetical protein
MILLAYILEYFPLLHGLGSDLIGHLLHQEHRPVRLIDNLPPDLCLEL